MIKKRIKSKIPKVLSEKDIEKLISQPSAKVYIKRELLNEYFKK